MAMALRSVRMLGKEYKLELLSRKNPGHLKALLPGMTGKSGVSILNYISPKEDSNSKIL